MFVVHQMLFVTIYDRYVRLGFPLFVSVILFCPSFWYVSTAFEVHKTYGPK